MACNRSWKELQEGWKPHTHNTCHPMASPQLYSSLTQCPCSDFHGRTRKHGYWQGELFSSSAFFRGLGVLAFPLVFPLTKHRPKEPSSFPVLPDSPSFPSPFLKHNSCPGRFSPCFSHLPVTTTVFLMEPVLPLCRFPWLYFIHRTKTTFLVLTFYI